MRVRLYLRVRFENHTIIRNTKNAFAKKQCGFLTYYQSGTNAIVKIRVASEKSIDILVFQ